eukprot:TRINITY_DN6881_c0_g1_i2.p1 TRINITY_DN6881_c0_g1~~TRINITY_DN6881_c0_g1_i2.p1  ORF type:complete len:210 (-),score=47.02 TRINITY_DN6881_c0_g1_i2:40-669(-)
MIANLQENVIPKLSDGLIDYFQRGFLLQYSTIAFAITAKIGFLLETYADKILVDSMEKEIIIQAEEPVRKHVDLYMEMAKDLDIARVHSEERKQAVIEQVQVSEVISEISEVKPIEKTEITVTEQVVISEHVPIKEEIPIVNNAPEPKERIEVEEPPKQPEPPAEEAAIADEPILKRKPISKRRLMLGGVPATKYHRFRNRIFSFRLKK